MSSRQRLLLVLWAAGGVSVACNVLSAQASLVGRGVAAWPPVALLLVVEVLARSPLPDGRLRWVAVAGAGVVAGVAGVASFHHMHSVALEVGESALVAWLFPLSVDGLAVVASVALVGSGRHVEVQAVDVREVQPSAPVPARVVVEPVTVPAPRFVPLASAGVSSPALNGAGYNQTNGDNSHA